MQPSDCAARLKLQLKPCTADSGFAARCEESGCSPSVTGSPSKYWGSAPGWGLSPKFQRPTNGGAQPPPHIGRQSRCERILHRQKTRTCRFASQIPEQQPYKTTAYPRNKARQSKAHAFRSPLTSWSGLNFEHWQHSFGQQETWIPGIYGESILDSPDG